MKYKNGVIFYKITPFLAVNISYLPTCGFVYREVFCINNKINPFAANKSTKTFPIDAKKRKSHKALLM